MGATPPSNNTTMTTFTDSLFRIDPTEGLLQYVQSIKPYHTKVLDVYVEYVYTEAMTVSGIERHQLTVQLDPTCASIQLIRADVGNNQIVGTSVGGNLPKVSIGDTLRFAHNSYVGGDRVFTVESVNLVDGELTLTLFEPISIEHTKHPADVLSTVQINEQLIQGLVNVGCYPRIPTVYSCGYGMVWDNVTTNDIPTPTILSAEAVDDRSATITVGSQDIALGAAVTNHTYVVGDVVTILTTGLLPETAEGPMYIGQPLSVVSVVGSIIRVSDEPAGAPITFTNAGSGTLIVRLLSPTLNSFIVTSPTPIVYPTAIRSLESNQLFIASRNEIVQTNLALNSIYVNGDITSIISAGDDVTISGSPDLYSNKPFIVHSVVFAGGLTQIRMEESIPATIMVGGYLNTAYADADLPAWGSGTAVQLTATATYTGSSLFPTPIVGSTTYYIQPTPTIGAYNLSHVRFPTTPSDFVDITALGTGLLTIQRTEPFTIGDSVSVVGSVGAINDGVYTIIYIEPYGGNFRLFTSQAIPASTPIGASADGVMTKNGSFGSPHCALVSAHPLHADTMFSERLTFHFGDADTVGIDDSIPPYDVSPLQ